MLWQKKQIFKLTESDLHKIINEISSQFIQNAISSKFHDDNYADTNERDKRIRDMRYKAVEKYNDEHPYFHSGLDNRHNDSEWLSKYSKCPLKIIDDDYKTLEDLYNGVKSGRLLIHCREMQGIEDGLSIIYPEAGETVQDAYGTDYAECGLEIPELVFASDNFNWAHNTRNGIYFIESDNFQRSLGDGRVQFPDGEISSYCINDMPLTVESGDWYSDEPVYVVAYMNTKGDKIDENTLPKINWNRYVLENRGIKDFRPIMHGDYLGDSMTYKYGLKKLPLTEVADKLLKKNLKFTNLNEELGISDVVDEESQKIIDLITNSLNNLKKTKDIRGNIIIKEGNFEIELFDGVKFDLHLIQQDCTKEMFKKFCKNSGASSWNDKKVVIYFVTVNGEIKSSELIDTIYHEFEHLYQSFKKDGSLVKNQDKYEYAISLMESENQFDNILGRVIYLAFNIEEYALNQGMYGQIKYELNKHRELQNKDELNSLVRKTEPYQVYAFLKFIKREFSNNKNLIEHTYGTRYSLKWYQKNVDKILKNLLNNIARTITKLKKEFNIE